MRFRIDGNLDGKLWPCFLPLRMFIYGTSVHFQERAATAYPSTLLYCIPNYLYLLYSRDRLPVVGLLGFPTPLRLRPCPGPPLSSAPFTVSPGRCQEPFFSIKPQADRGQGHQLLPVSRHIHLLSDY
jgi:hypothetical protein